MEEKQEDVGDVFDDVLAEFADLKAIVVDIEPATWDKQTPASGWSISHQIAHLSWTDWSAITAIENPNDFDKLVAEAIQQPDSFIETSLEPYLRLEPAELLGRWEEGVTKLVSALRNLPSGSKIPWFGPPMAARTMASARLMEMWAHGQDIADTLGITRTFTKRLYHVCLLGVRTRNFAYVVNDLKPPEVDIYVRLSGPDGVLWVWGDEKSEQSVSGSALDFCFLVTQRRNRADLDLVAVGPDADKWLDIAQAFAGRPGEGRAPLST